MASHHCENIEKDMDFCHTNAKRHWICVGLDKMAPKFRTIIEGQFRQWNSINLYNFFIEAGCIYSAPYKTYEQIARLIYWIAIPLSLWNYVSQRFVNNRTSWSCYTYILRYRLCMDLLTNIML